MLNMFRKSDPAENQKFQKIKKQTIIFQLECFPQLNYHATAPTILKENNKKEEKDQRSLYALQTMVLWSF